MTDVKPDVDLAAISIIVGSLAVIASAAQARVRNSLATPKADRGRLQLVTDAIVCIGVLFVAVGTAVVSYPLAGDAWRSFEFGSSAQVANGLFLIVWILLPLLTMWPLGLIVRLVRRQPYVAQP